MNCDFCVPELTDDFLILWARESTDDEWFILDSFRGSGATAE